MDNIKIGKKEETLTEEMNSLLLQLMKGAIKIIFILIYFILYLITIYKFLGKQFGIPLSPLLITYILLL